MSSVATELEGKLSGQMRMDFNECDLIRVNKETFCYEDIKYKYRESLLTEPPSLKCQVSSVHGQLVSGTLFPHSPLTPSC